MEENYEDELMDPEDDLYDEDAEDLEQEVLEHVQQPEAQQEIHDVAQTTQQNKTEQKQEKTEEVLTESALDKLSYKSIISYLYDKFCEVNKGINHIDEEWAKVRSQINSALQLQIPRKFMEEMISLEYSYEQREVIKFMRFSGCPEEFVGQMKPELTYKEMIARYDASKVESTVSNMLDTPLNTMSRLVNDYKEDLAKFRTETENKISEYEQQLKEKDAELEETKQELQSLKKRTAAEAEKKSKEQIIQAEAEKLAQEMFLMKKEEFDAENRRNQEVEELYRRIDMLEHGQQGSTRQKKHRLFGRREKKESIPQSPVTFNRNLPLPKNFDISAYMMQSNLSSSQLDVIALAAKCGLSDQVLKDMIDSGKDARQLKQIVEVFLAKREQEKAVAAANSDPVKQEEIIYD